MFDQPIKNLMDSKKFLAAPPATTVSAKTTTLAEVMTASPKTLAPNKSYGHALLLMQENGFRHVPVVENGKAIGIISSRNAMDPDLEEFVFEERRREHHR